MEAPPGPPAASQLQAVTPPMWGAPPAPLAPPVPAPPAPVTPAVPELPACPVALAPAVPGLPASGRGGGAPASGIGTGEHDPFMHAWPPGQTTLVQPSWQLPALQT